VNRYDHSQSIAFYRESLSRLATLPGVQQAAGATCLPVPFACIGTSFWRVDRPRPTDGQLPSGEVRPITPDLFKTIGIPQIAGRDFSESDTVTSVPVAIVSESLARQQFADENPLGRRLRVNVDHANGREDVEWTIVGVVGNTRSTLDGPVKQTIYIPRTQRPSNSVRFFIRSAQDPAMLAPAATRLIRSMEADAPVQSLTLEDAVGSTIARPRALSWLVGVFALAALALAAVGVYGVTAYSVRQRTQEIGVRIALGATAPSVLRLVLGQAVQLVAIGVATGLAAAAALTRLLARLLFEVGPFDPWTFSATALLLVLVGTVASYVPARRCIGLAPLDALRTN
jgi:putative ABC transport system permease protein